MIMWDLRESNEWKLEKNRIMKINRIKAWLNWSFQPKMNYNCESMRIVIRFSLEPNHQSANAMGDIVTVFGISLGEQRNHLWMNYAELKVIVAQFTSGEGGPSRTHSVAESREKSARLEDTNAIAIVITYSRACDYLVRTLITVKTATAADLSYSSLCHHLRYRTMRNLRHRTTHRASELNG